MDTTEEPLARTELRQTVSLQRLAKSREWRFALAPRHIVGGPAGQPMLRLIQVIHETK